MLKHVSTLLERAKNGCKYCDFTISTALHTITAFHICLLHQKTFKNRLFTSDLLLNGNRHDFHWTFFLKEELMLKLHKKVFLPDCQRSILFLRSWVMQVLASPRLSNAKEAKLISFTRHYSNPVLGWPIRCDKYHNSPSMLLDWPKSSVQPSATHICIHC